MEVPSITASSYASSSLDPAVLGMLANPLGVMQHHDGPLQQAAHGLGLANQLNLGNQANLGARQQMRQAIQQLEQPMSARIVKVFIADPNENLPLDKRVLYTGDEKLTDLTDQELFFEVPISEILAKHNAVRKTVVDKKQAEKFGRDIFLEPARIRDLKMVVVNVAQF